MKTKFRLQNNQYVKPYHHYVDFEELKIHEELGWGLEYISYVSEIKKLIKNTSYKKIAEVGCGDGKITLELAKENEEKTFEGWDLSKEAIYFAKAYGQYQKNLKFFDKNFSKSKTKYDAIVCVETLEHIPNEEIEQFIKTIQGHILKKGKFIITVPTTNLKLHPKHYRHYNINLLKKQTEKYFTIKNIKYVYNRKSIKTKLTNFMLINPLFILKNNKLRKTIINQFLKKHNKTKANKGSHLIVVLEKK